MIPKAAQDLSPELKYALEPMTREIESASERICEYDQMLESMARNGYPEVERLKQIKGVGTPIALTYMLTLEDPYRFRKSRDAACHVGLQPGRRNSGQSEPQMHISKSGRYVSANTLGAGRTIMWSVREESTATCPVGA